jgi:Uma2 family endonuclease
MILSGEAGIRLRRNPDTTVGVDVVYLSPQVVATDPQDNRVLDAVPLLAVEILSPSDKHQEITEKVQSYLDAGVGLVWVVEPRFRTVTVYRPDAQPQLFNVTHTLSCDPHLPGFSVLVKDIFEL